MTPPAPKNPLQHLRASDVRGIAQLATQATSGVARIAEGVHQSVWSTMGVPGGKVQGQTRGITGLVYRSVQGITQLLGKQIPALDGKAAFTDTVQSGKKTIYHARFAGFDQMGAKMACLKISKLGASCMTVAPQS